MSPTRLALQSLENEKAYAEARLAASPETGWGTERLMWQNRLEEIEAELTATAARVNNTASVALVFEGRPVTGQTQIRLDFSTDALEAFQQLVAATLAAQRGGSVGKRGPTKGVDQSRLHIRELVHGSMGFLLEEQPGVQQDMLPSALKNAVEGSTDLLARLSVGDENSFENAAVHTQPRVLSAVQRFARVLSSFGATARVAADTNEADIDSADVELLERRLSEITFRETVEALSGVLLGVFPDSHQFELKLPGDEAAMHGSISDELAEAYRSDADARDSMLMQQVRATIRTITSVRRGRAIGEQRILEAIEPRTARLE